MKTPYQKRKAQAAAFRKKLAKFIVPDVPGQWQPKRTIVQWQRPKP